MLFRFADFELYVPGQVLRRANGAEIPLRAQSFEVLAYLLSEAPGIISREQLLREVWGHEALSESSVAQTIKEIRKALNDSAARPRILATRRGRGYQIICPVSASNLTEKLPANPLDPPQPVAPIGMHNSPASGLPSLSVTLAMVLAVGILFGTVLDDFASGGLEPVSGSQRNVAEDELALAAQQFPRDAETRSVWLLGRAHRDRLQFVRAVAAFERVIASEPDALTARLDLIESLLDAGFSRRAAELLRDERLQATQFSRREALRLRALQARQAGNLQTAEAIYRSLAEFFPEDPAYLFSLARIQRNSDSVGQLEQTLARLRTLIDKVDHAGQLQIDLLEIENLLWTGQFQLAVDWGRDLAADADRLGLSSIEATAQYLRGAALTMLGRQSLAREALAAAQNIFKTQPSERDLGLVSAMRVDLELAVGDLDAATRFLEHLCRTAKRLDQSHLSGLCVLMRGRLELRQFRSDSAVALLRDAVRNFDQTGHLRLKTDALVDLGIALTMDGELHDADLSHANAEMLAGELELDRSMSNIRICQGAMLAMRGLPDLAVKRFEAALELATTQRNTRIQAIAHGHLAATYQSMGEFAAAELHGTRSATLLQEGGDRILIARFTLQRGVAARQLGQYDLALHWLKLAAEDFRALDFADSWAEATAEIVNILIDQAELDQAHVMLDRAGAVDLKPGPEKLALAVARARLALVEARFTQAAELFAEIWELRDGGRKPDWQPSPQTMLEQARLALEAGRPDVAESLARETLASENDQPLAAGDRLDARLLLARALIERDALDDARTVLQTIEPSLANRLGMARHLEFKALSHASSGARGEPMLRAIRDRAEEMGLRLLAMETDVLLAASMYRDNRKEQGDEVIQQLLQLAERTGVACVVAQVKRL